MPVFQVSHLSKEFNGKKVLRDISMSVEKGEIVAIIGPSGSGKTTLLRCATLLETMTGGSLSYGDVKVAEDQNGVSVYASQKTLGKARKLFGLVFQNYNLFPHMSVLTNIIDAPIHVHGEKKQSVIRHAKELLKQMGLEGRENAYPCELSGGQQQRVSIARALALMPDILFFDEPTSALDPELTNEILKAIRKLAEHRMTMVIVTHEIGFAANVADRIVFMADGVIVEDGSAKELVANPKNERTRAFLAGMSAK